MAVVGSSGRWVNEDCDHRLGERGQGARKIERELGWKPRESFETGIRKTIEWFLQNEEWVKGVTSGAYRKWIATQYS